MRRRICFIRCTFCIALFLFLPYKLREAVYWHQYKTVGYQVCWFVFLLCFLIHTSNCSVNIQYSLTQNGSCSLVPWFLILFFMTLLKSGNKWVRYLRVKSLFFMLIFFFLGRHFDFWNYLCCLEVLSLALQVNTDPENRCPDADCTCGGSLTDISINRLYGVCSFGLEYWHSVPRIWWSLQSIRR